MTRTNSLYGALALVVLAIVSVLAFEASRGAFSSSTESPANTFDAGDVSLSDNDQSSAMFSLTDVVPGAANRIHSCIDVTYDGSVVPAAVRLYTAGGDLSGGLGAYLDLVVERGAGAAGFGDCSGFAANETVFTGTLESFAATHVDFASGAGSWAPAVTAESQSYRFRLTLQNDGGAAGQTADVVFTWGAENQ